MRDMPRKRVCVYGKGRDVMGGKREDGAAIPVSGSLDMQLQHPSHPKKAANNAQGLAVWELSAVLL